MEHLVLADLEPRPVFRFFEEFCGVPHGSGNTAAASRYVSDFARERHLKYRQDGLGNVIVWKPASPGYETHPAVILQGHLDMVCVKDPGVAHDFDRDPLRLVVEDGWVAARGTTLGGDDGIAVAMILALLDDPAALHPPLEAVFTVDEEIGLLGAAGLDCSGLAARQLINLDSENEGVLTAGCAGGVRCDLALPFPTQPAQGEVYTVSISGLPGGHSGTEIHKNIPNANRLLAQSLREAPNVRLISLHGGEQDNAIPDRASAVVVLPEGAAVRDEASAPVTFTRNEPGRTPEALSVEDSRRALDVILAAPNGVQSMEPDLPGQVRTSLNLGVLRLDKGQLRLTWSVRSSVAEEKESLVQTLQSLSDCPGASFNRRGDYPAWSYRAQSPLRDVMTRVYRRQTGREMQVETIHAGLECGLFADKLPGLDAVSIGPDLRDIHSAREKMSIPSVQRMWAYLTGVLREL